MVDRVTAVANRQQQVVSVKRDMVASKPVVKEVEIAAATAVKCWPVNVVSVRVTAAVKAAAHYRAVVIHMAGMLRVKERAAIAGKAEETTVLPGSVQVI